VTLLGKSTYTNPAWKYGNFTHDKSGSIVEIPKNSLVDQNGQVYKGVYTVNLSFIDMSDKNSWRGMPGGFTGYLGAGG